MTRIEYVRRHVTKEANLAFRSLGVCIAWLCVVVGVETVNAYGPTTEGYVFPVLGNTQITRIIPGADASSSDVYGSLTKFRDCTWLNTEWYLDYGSRSVRVPVRIAQAIAPTKPGVVNFGPLSLPVPPDEVIPSTHAIAYHRCHPYWVTETRFWGSPKTTRLASGP